jgi:hypothetical protein
VHPLGRSLKYPAAQDTKIHGIIRQFGLESQVEKEIRVGGFFFSFLFGIIKSKLELKYQGNDTITAKYSKCGSILRQIKKTLKERQSCAHTKSLLFFGLMFDN